MDTPQAGTEDAGRVLRLLEQQRQWIASELHDAVVQDITGARMQLEAVVLAGKIPEGEPRDAVVKAIQLLRNAVEEARRIILGLRPPMLEERGLIGAIKSLLAEGVKAGLKVRFKADVAFRRLDESLETGIYRIVQEGLTNIQRHSQAERAEVRIAQVGKRLEILIRDWGVGFDPTRVGERSFGLKGICQRARLLGGSARVDSQPGKGTRIAVSLPLAGPLETTVP